MKRDIYAYITTFVLIVAVGFSAFLIVSDNKFPFTTQATVKASVIEVVPLVSGYIDEVFVQEGQAVEEDTPLFQIDPTNYKMLRDKASAHVREAKATWQQSDRYYARILSLFHSGSASQEQLDEANTDREQARSVYDAAQAELDLANRDLSNTLVVAKQQGTVTNFGYRAGMYVSPASSVLHLVDTNTLWIAADFTEKGLPQLTPNKKVEVVFDALPGKRYFGHIKSIDQSIDTGQDNPSQLVHIDTESRWIRPQQKVRVRVELDETPTYLIAGSRASVMVQDTHHIASIWMSILSWLRYLY